MRSCSICQEHAGSKAFYGAIFRFTVNDLPPKVESVTDGLVASFEAILSRKLPPAYFVSVVVGNVNIYGPFTRISKLIRGRMDLIAFVRKHVHQASSYAR
jgi:hypothetical protein